VSIPVRLYHTLYSSSLSFALHFHPIAPLERESSPLLMFCFRAPRFYMASLVRVPPFAAIAELHCGHRKCAVASPPASGR